MNLLETLLPWLVGVAVLVAGWFTGRKTGKAAERQRQMEQDYKARREADDEREEVRKMDADTIRRDAARWVRGTKR